MSRPLEGTSGRASGVAAVLLQFRSAASGAEIRAGHADASHACGNHQKAANVTAGLPFANGPSGIVRGRPPCSSILHSLILWRECCASGVLTTFVGGSTIRAVTCSTLLGPCCSENTQDAVSVATASARAYGSSRISGCFSATTSSFSAASLGVRRPCSQSWMVRALTLSSFANMD